MDPLLWRPAPSDAASAQSASRLARHAGLKRLGFVALVYISGAAVAVTGALTGSQSAWVVALQIGYWSLGNLIFFALLLAGVGARGPDPMLVFAQVIFGITALALSYAVSAVSRGMTLQLLFLLLVFDMQRLTEAQIRFAARLALGLLAITLAGLAAWRPEQVDLSRDALVLGLVAVHVPLLSFLARRLRSIRVRQEENRLSLDQALGRLEEMAIRDGLTGAFNRRHGMALAQLEVQRLARGGRPCAIVLIDLDHFKQINDRFGHATGDAVLRGMAQVAAGVCDATDSFVRWGGEEFLLLMPLSDLDAARSRVERLRSAFAAQDWHDHAHGLAPTLSAGLVSLHPGESVEAAVDRADQALYDAKRSGRNCIQVHDDGGH